MMVYEFDNIKKDLSLRQNKEVTTAQCLDIATTKRYTSKDLDDFVKSTKDKSSILNSNNPAKAVWEYEEHNLCRVLAGFNNVTILALDIKESKTNHISDVYKVSRTNKSTIVQMQLLDVKREHQPQVIKIKYPAGLLDEFIQEYKKIIKWLEDNNWDTITLNSKENPIQIHISELETTINFFEKMKLVSEEK